MVFEPMSERLSLKLYVESARSINPQGVDLFIPTTQYTDRNSRRDGFYYLSNTSLQQFAITFPVTWLRFIEGLTSENEGPWVLSHRK